MTGFKPRSSAVESDLSVGQATTYALPTSLTDFCSRNTINFRKSKIGCFAYNCGDECWQKWSSLGRDRTSNSSITSDEPNAKGVN